MYYIGVDGGGTKTKFVLSDEKGIVIASNIQPSANYIQVGFDGMVEIFNDGLNKLLEEAKVSRVDIANCFVGCSGYGDVKKEEAIINEYLLKVFKDIKFQVGNDGENAMAGSLGGKDGINIVAGTGSIAFGHNSLTNKTMKAGGWHQLIGSDEGSGYWQAIELLKAFERQSDGRDNKTLLYNAVKQELNIKDDGEVITKVVEEWNMDRTKVASLSKIVSKLAMQDDQAANAIILKAAHDLADIVIALYKRLEFKDKIIITYTGGIWKIGEKILSPFKNDLKELNVEICSPVLEPDAGALILALKNDDIEITNDVIKNLKETCK